MKTQDVYSVTFFKNPAWGLRSPHNRMEFQKALVAADYPSAEALALEYMDGVPHRVFKRKVKDRLVVHFESNSLLVKIVRTLPVKKENSNDEGFRVAV